MPNTSFNLQQSQFTVRDIPSALRKFPTRYRPLGSLGLFNQKPLRTTFATIEREEWKFQSYTLKPRRSDAEPFRRPERFIKTQPIPQLAIVDTVFNDDVIDQRAFGTANDSETIEGKASQLMEWMINNYIEPTMEIMRISALFGKVLQGDGSIYLDWNEEIGIENPTYQIDPSTIDLTDINNLKNLVMRQTYGNSNNGFMVICGIKFWQGFLKNENILKAYMFQESWFNRGEWLKTAAEQGMDAFKYGGVNWLQYPDFSFMNQTFPEDKAILLPLGYDGKFIEFMGPSTFNNEKGQGAPYYVYTKDKEYQNGIEVYVQTNRLMIDTYPESTIVLTMPEEQTT